MISRLLTLVTVISALLLMGISAGAQPTSGPSRPGELLVAFEASATPSQRAQAHAESRGQIKRSFPEIGLDVVELSPGVDVSRARASYTGRRGVRFAEPNFLRSTSSTVPNDPSFGLQWGLHNSGQAMGGRVGTPDADTDASETTSPDAWDLSTGSGEVVVAILDTGVQPDHPDLGANIWNNVGEVPGNGLDDDLNGYIDDRLGWDFYSNDSSVYDPQEVCSNGSANDVHGTHVAGTVGAVGNNALGISGAAWNVKLMILKFLGATSAECQVGSDADAVEAILYATRMGADVINMSWGGTSGGQALKAAIESAGAAGIVFAAAAGNGGSDGKGDDLSLTPYYPASYNLQNQVAVAASTNTDTLAAFSNYGGATTLTAPGTYIYGTIVGNGYGWMSGTSMATPFVSGAAALMKSVRPTMSPEQIKIQLAETADDKTVFASPVTASGGRLNIARALGAPSATLDPSPSPSPSPAPQKSPDQTSPPAPAPAPATQVSGFESLGGSLESGPDVSSWSANRLDVFARGGDGSLVHKWWDGQSWSGWESLGGYLASDPAAVSWGPNRIDVFTRGTDNQLYHRWWDGSAWGGWESLGGYITSAPEVSSWSSGRLDIFARGGNGSLVHKWWDGRTWSGWEDLGGSLASDPSAISWGFNRIDVFAKGVNGDLVHTWWDGSRWPGWESLGGSLASGPDVSSWAPGRLDVFARGHNNELVHTWWDGSRWPGWETLAGGIVSDPGAVSWGFNRIDVFGKGPDGTLLHKWWDGRRWLP